jgi:hypothetical protein
MIKKNLLLLLCILFLSNTIHGYELSICAIFRDEAKYLPEWIEFHRKQGVEHFYLYDNLSVDEPESYLRSYIKKNIVSLISWPYESVGLQDWNPLQCKAYEHCVNSARTESKWIAFLDTDEFLFCLDGTKLPKFLRKFKEHGALSVNWVMYGTSNTTLQENEKITEQLVYRAELNTPRNIHVKSIVQTQYIVGFVNPHYPLLHEGKQQVTENQQPFYGPFSPYISVEQIRINHYWSRDLDFFYNEKIPRGEKWGKNRDEIIQAESDLNAVFDPVLNPFYNYWELIKESIRKKKKSNLLILQEV